MPSKALVIQTTVIIFKLSFEQWEKWLQKTSQEEFWIEVCDLYGVHVYTYFLHSYFEHYFWNEKWVKKKNVRYLYKLH